MPGKKANNNKSYAQHEDWQKGKRVGRPQQVWVPATLYGEPFLPTSTEEIEQLINDESIGSYVPGHWEKTKLYFVGTTCAEQLEK